VSGDTVMTYLGDCPATIKPGQFLKPDGTIYDPAADMASLGTRRQSGEPASK
jgi:hypothetical protein